MEYSLIIKAIEDNLKKMKMPSVSIEEFRRRLDKFKFFNYYNLSDNDIFWMLTYVLFFNLGKKASMIEKKLPLFKQYLYGYKRLGELSTTEIQDVVSYIGFNKQVNWCVLNAQEFTRLINQYGSFKDYLLKRFHIKDIYCSNIQLSLLYDELKIRFKGIGETAGWHFITELGFFTLKPDKVIRRIFYRLGLVDDENNLEKCIDIGRDISKKLGIPIRYIDIIFVKFGQVGQSDVLGTVDGICTENNPKCFMCNLSPICKYFNNKSIDTMAALGTLKENKIAKPIINKDQSITLLNENSNRNNQKVQPEIKLMLTPKFKQRYDNASDELKKLFNSLINQINLLGIENFSTDTPDYRLKKKYNFGLITFISSEGTIRIHLRVDDLNISSFSSKIRRIEKHNYNGREWIEIKISDEKMIEETIDIIKYIYDNL